MRAAIVSAYLCSMSGKRLFYILFFTVLIVGFFTVMSFAIPGFLERKLPPISRMQPFSFTTQDGEIFTEKDMENKVVAVNYFFTTCKGICPKMNNNLKPVYEACKDLDGFLMVSHTCDPVIDDVARLKRFTDSMQIDTKKWVFLTGRKDSLYIAARYIYKIDDPNNNPTKIEDDFMHSQFIALVNRKGEIVKIYDALRKNEVAEMRKDIIKLLRD